MSRQEWHGLSVITSIVLSILFPAFIYIGRRNDWKCVNLPVLLTGCAVLAGLMILNAYLRSSSK